MSIKTKYSITFGDPAFEIDGNVINLIGTDADGVEFGVSVDYTNYSALVTELGDLLRARITPEMLLLFGFMSIIGRSNNAGNAVSMINQLNGRTISLDFAETNTQNHLKHEA